MKKALLAVFGISALLAACAGWGRELKPLGEMPGRPEAISLVGDTLYPPELPADVRQDRLRRLSEAQVTFDADPGNVEAIIWLGRRTAYLGQYRKAVEIYSVGIEKHPTDARSYRHRGHRYISLRRFPHAIADLQQAAQLIAGTEDQLEPDGLPNVRNMPRSTLHSNVWYHLGLVYYLTGDFERALEAYRQCLAVSNNPDMLVATSHWLYMTLRRLDRNDEARRVREPIHADMDIIENHSYHRLLLMYKGQIEPEALMRVAADALTNATVGYGVGNWHFYNGRAEPAVQVFRQVLEGGQWAAFGYIAAEADLSRL